MYELSFLVLFWFICAFHPEFSGKSFPFLFLFLCGRFIILESMKNSKFVFVKINLLNAEADKYI